MVATMSESVKVEVKPVEWQVRHFDEVNKAWTGWRTIRPLPLNDGAMSVDEQLEGYRSQIAAGQQYEIRALYDDIIMAPEVEALIKAAEKLSFAIVHELNTKQGEHLGAAFDELQDALHALMPSRLKQAKAGGQ